MARQPSLFNLRDLSIRHETSPFKIGTDALLLAGSCNQSYQICADLCAGCGIVGLILARKNPDALVHLFEIDDQACQEARLNIKANNLSDRMEVFCEDVTMLHSNHTTRPKYDLIVCNPPFFYNDLKPESDRLKLAKHATTDFPSKLIATISRYLSESGSAHLIIPEKNLAQFQSISEEHKLFIRQKVAIKQLPDKPVSRYVIVLSPQFQECDSSELVICQSSKRNDWSESYKSWLNDIKVFI